jgi:uncharacterized protein (DUF983 family)
MVRILRAFFDALLLHCPHCHKGRMFSSLFQMRQHCPICNLPFERSTGEITGGMGVSIVVILILTVIASALIGFSSVPLVPAFLIGGVAIVVFAILFYPVSRALWVALIYVTGAGQEPD